jgi:HD-like signal output (HDOD) protein
MNASPQDLVQSMDAIGTVPSSVAQIFSLFGDPRTNATDFERVVRPDVGLTANLLRCANSVFYRATREITSVRDAINRMGLRRVFEVAASSSFAHAIPAKLTGYTMTAQDYWDHSVAVAVLSDRIGKAAGFTYPDLAFTSGLLHDLGKVVVATFLGRTSEAAWPPEGLRTVDEENALLGTDHVALGELLAAKWNLPKEICGASRWHHEPDSAPTATLRYLATVVQVADGAAHVAAQGVENASRPLSPDALERLNLEPERVLDILAAAKGEIERTSEMLRGTLGRAA